MKRIVLCLPQPYPPPLSTPNSLSPKQTSLLLIYPFQHLCMHTHTHTHLLTHKNTYMLSLSHTHTHTHTHMHLLTHINTRTHIQIDTHTHTKHTHTPKQTHTLPPSPPPHMCIHSYSNAEKTYSSHPSKTKGQCTPTAHTHPKLKDNIHLQLTPIPNQRTMYKA